MIIKGVKLENIRSYINGKIEFPQGSTLLAGEIGSGKTSILLAIEFALFGITRGVVSGTSLLRTGTDKGSVELHLTINKKDIIIKRTLKRQKTDVRQDSGYIIINDIKKEATPVELKSIVLDLLGYPPQLLTKSKSLIYRYTVYTPQEEMKQILMEKSEYRLDTLRKVFQIDKYRLIRENTQIVIRTLKQKQSMFQGIIQDLPEKQELLIQTQAELQKSQHTLTLTEQQLTKLDALLQQKQQTLAKLESETRELSSLKNQIEVQQTQLNEKALMIQNRNKDLDKLKTDVLNLTEKLNNMKIPDIKDDAILQAQIDKEQAKHNKLIKMQAEQENNIKQQQMTIQNEQRVIEDLSKLKVCPLCKQDVNPLHIKEVKQIQDRKIESAKLEIQNQQNNLKSTQDNLIKVKSLLQELTEKQRSINQAKIQAKEKQNLQNLIKDKTIQKAAIEQDIKLIKSEVGNLNSKRLETQKRIEAYKTLDDEFKNLKKEMETLFTKEKELTTAYTKSKTEVTSKKEVVMSLQEDILKRTKAKEKLQQLKEIQNWLQELFLNLLTTMEQHVMMRVYNEFNEIIQQFFEMLAETEVMTIRLDEEFTPIIEQNGYEVEYEHLSGGEKTSIALAYRLALNKVINHLIENIKTRDIIILDEPTDGFSTQQLDKIRDVLDVLDTNQTIIVSHEAKIESFVENIIRVNKHEHISTVT